MGFSHVDFWLAVRWLRWVSRLCLEPAGASSDMTLVLFGARRITEAQWDELRKCYYQSPCMFKVEPVSCPDEREIGYPRSANHLFLRALEHCDRTHRGQPVLWLEADTCAMKPGWAQAIQAEHRALGKPFMGCRSHAGKTHMPGNAVYPHDWRKRSPCLATALTLTSAWDTACAGEIVRQSSVATTIFQLWRPRHINESTLAAIPATTAIFHQDKTASLCAMLEGRLKTL